MTTITVYNKIGFHTGPAGNRNGINKGGFMERLDQARIPFVIKSVDDYGPCFEAAEYVMRSGVPHVIVFRMTAAGQNDGFMYDVPLYNEYPDDPHTAAALHWQHTLNTLPPEFNKQHVWLELINEVDRKRSDWLGYFAVDCANFALRDGYKIALFGWSSGEPEPEDWALPGMLAYLRLCAQYPEQISISLHEYSYVKEDIRDGFPYKLGRFKQLFAVCDQHGLRRPTVHITEWGWEYDHVPAPDQAMKDIRWANELYAPYPEVKGAAIWYLGDWVGRIYDQAQRLIVPVTEMALHETYTVTRDEPAQPGVSSSTPPMPEIPSPPAPPPPVDPDPHPPITTTPITGPQPPDPTTPTPITPPHPVMTPPSPPVVTPAPPGDSQLKFLADVTIPDYTHIKPGQNFVKTWRLQNTGQTTWGPGFTLVFLPNPAKGGQPMSEQLSFPLAEVASQATVAPGETVEISLTLTAPNPGRPQFDFSDWKLHDARGRAFGDILFTIIVVDPNA